MMAPIDPLTPRTTGDDSHGHAERVVVRGANGGGLRGPLHSHLPHRRRRRRARPGHPFRRWPYVQCPPAHAHIAHIAP
jgi:hypothetical protein